MCEMNLARCKRRLDFVTVADVIKGFAKDVSWAIGVKQM